jgi:hypothetical protein
MMKYNIGITPCSTSVKIHSAYIEISYNLFNDRQLLFPAFTPNTYKGFYEMKIFLKQIVIHTYEL